MRKNSRTIAASGISRRCNFVGFQNAEAFKAMVDNRAWSFCVIVAGTGPFLSFERTDASGVFTDVFVTTTASSDHGTYGAEMAVRVNWTVKLAQHDRAPFMEGNSDGKTMDEVAEVIEAARKAAVSEARKAANAALAA